MVLVLLDLLLQLVDGDLGVLNNAVDLELLDSETNSDEGVSTPDKTICKPVSIYPFTIT